MGRFDFGFGFGFGGHREQCLYTKPRATSQQTVFFCGWGVGEVQLRLRVGEGGHHPVFFLREGVGRFDFGFGGHCEQCVHRARRIIPAHLFLCVEEEGWGGSTSGSASGSVVIASNVCTKPRASSQQTGFFLWIGGVGEVRLRVRLRVRWALRGISVQSPVHHPSNLFFLSRGGWGGSTSGSASGSMVISSNVCTKPGASCQQTFGAWGGSTSGSALGTRLLSNRNIISSAFGTQSSVRQ